MPIPVCDNYRICRSHLYPRKKHGEAFRGYIPSKHRYFYGLRVHLLMTTAGLPVVSDAGSGQRSGHQRVPAFLWLGLPEKARIFADAGYLDQHEEALLKDAELHLIAQRRGNSKQPLAPYSFTLCGMSASASKRYSGHRGGVGAAPFMRSFRPKGFELKVFLTVLAYTITATL